MNGKFALELTKYLILAGICAVVDVLWVLLEIAIYGETKPNHADTIISVALTLSLYMNLRRYIHFGGDK